MMLTPRPERIVTIDDNTKMVASGYLAHFRSGVPSSEAHCVLPLRGEVGVGVQGDLPFPDKEEQTRRRNRDLLFGSMRKQLEAELQPAAEKWAAEVAATVFAGELDEGEPHSVYTAATGIIAAAAWPFARAIAERGAPGDGKRWLARELCRKGRPDGCPEHVADKAAMKLAALAERFERAISLHPGPGETPPGMTFESMVQPRTPNQAKHWLIGIIEEQTATIPEELIDECAESMRAATPFALFFEGARELEEPGHYELQPGWLRDAALLYLQAEQAAWEAAQARFASRKVEAVTQRGVTDIILRPQDQLNRRLEYLEPESAAFKIVEGILKRVDHNMKYYTQRALRIIIAKATRADGRLEQNVHWPNWAAFVQDVAGHRKHADKVRAAVDFLSIHHLRDYGLPGHSYESVIMLSGGGHGDQFTVTLSPFAIEPHRYPNARHNDRFLVPLTEAERTPRPHSPVMVGRYVLGYQQTLLYFSEYSLEYVERGSLPVKQLLDAVRDAAEFTSRRGGKQLDTWFEIATQGDNRPPQQRLQDPAPGVIFGGRFIELTDDGEIRLADSNPDYVRMIEDQGRQRLGGRRRQAAGRKKKRKG